MCSATSLRRLSSNIFEKCPVTSLRKLYCNISTDLARIIFYFGFYVGFYVGKCARISLWNFAMREIGKDTAIAESIICASKIIVKCVKFLNSMIRVFAILRWIRFLSNYHLRIFIHIANVQLNIMAIAWSVNANRYLTTCNHFARSLNVSTENQPCVCNRDLHHWAWSNDANYKNFTCSLISHTISIISSRFFYIYYFLDRELFNLLWKGYLLRDYNNPVI